MGLSLEGVVEIGKLYHVLRNVIANNPLHFDSTFFQSLPQSKRGSSISTAKIDNRNGVLRAAIPLSNDISVAIQCGLMVKLLKMICLDVGFIVGLLLWVEFDDFCDSLGEEIHVKERICSFSALLRGVGVWEEIREH